MLKKTSILLFSVLLAFGISACTAQTQESDAAQAEEEKVLENSVEEEETPCGSDSYDIRIYEGDMEPYYGTYEITEFVAELVSWNYTRAETIPGEEVDLMMGQKIVISEDIFSAYDNFRYHGAPKLESDYSILKYKIENPHYEFAEGSPFAIKGWTNLLTGQLEERLAYPYRRIQLKECFSIKSGEVSDCSTRTESYENDMVVPTMYVMDDDQLLWEAGRTGTCFVIKKISDDTTIEEQDIQAESTFPEKISGTYEVVKFYPTVYWKNREVGISRCMSESDVAEMIGKKVTLEEDYYEGYIFDSKPYFYEMYQDDPRIVAVAVESPEYRIREVKRSELYGLKDPIVPEIYQRETYQEIQIPESSFDLNVNWCYEGNAKYYVIDEDMNKLLMMYMKEFFLLEKCQ